LATTLAARTSHAYPPLLPRLSQKNKTKKKAGLARVPAFFFGSFLFLFGLEFLAILPFVVFFVFRTCKIY